MNALAILATSSSWFWPTLASVGGLLVFIGLWLEKGAEADWFRNVEDLKRQKLKSKWGWRILMFGILLEIVIGVALAVKDERDINRVSSNTPAKMRENSIFATAKFWVEIDGDNGIKYSPSDPKGLLTFTDAATLRSGETPLHLTLSCTEMQFDQEQWGPQPTNDVWLAFLHFNIDPLWDEDMWSTNILNKTSEELVEELNFFVLSPEFLFGKTAKIMHGKLTLVLNGSISKTFEIPPQIAEFIPGKLGQTNSSGIPMKYFINNF